MKVVQILPDLQGGGVEKGTLEVAKALVDNGDESVVISAGGRMVEQLEAEGSRHVQWDLGKKSLFTFRHIWALRRWITQECPDILHVRSRMPAWVVWLAWKGLPEATRPRFITTVHGLYSVSWYSEIMCKGEKVIAVSKTVERYIRENYPKTDMRKVELIYRGVDPEEFPYGYQPEQAWLDAWKSEYPQLAGKTVITLPGRLTRLKGHHDFIDLIARLRKQGHEVYGLCVGGEDPKRQAYAQELRAKVGELGLTNDVVFTGARSDIRDIYAVSDLVLSLSIKPESFGRTVLESLRMGVPTLGYDHGGVGEILNELYPQGKVPYANTDALFQCVVQLLQQSVLPAQSMQLTKQTMLANTLQVYKELCDKHAEVLNT